jgi:predicted dehydrogenase
MNAGYVSYDSWVHTEEGGGRIIGEGCHIFDVFRSLTGAPVESVSVDGVQPKTAAVRSSDNVVATVKYADGSVCTLLYTALGNTAAPKERMEVFCDEQLFVLNDYVRLESFGSRCSWEAKQADKGHLTELEYFAGQIKTGNRFPIPLDQLEETWLISRQVADQLTA